MDINAINEMACNLIKVTDWPESNTRFNVRKLLKNLDTMKVKSLDTMI